MAEGRVLAVARDGAHRFSKQSVPAIELVAGFGVRGDAHHGMTVQHRSRVAVDPGQPNLRQVHLIHAELFDELQAKGHHVHPAELGENVTTTGVNLLGLPQHAVLCIGGEAKLEVTGLRNPCAQIERFRPGLLSALLERGTHDELVRKAGIMAIVRVGGVVRPGDRIEVEMPPVPRLPLACV